MNSLKYFTPLFGIILLFSCQKDSSISEDLEIRSEVASQVNSQRITHECDDCKQLIGNPSFETVNGLVPGNLTHFNENLVPNWISISASPTIIDQNGYPNLPYSIPTGFDGQNITFMVVNGGINSQEAIAANVIFHKDYDLTYCLSFDYFAPSFNGNNSTEPTRLLAYMTEDVPPHTGSDNNSTFDVSQYAYKEIGAVTPSDDWQTFDTGPFNPITVGANFNQLSIVPYFEAQILGEEYSSSALAFVHVDDFELYCQTDALIGIEAEVDNQNGIVDLSAIFDGLPNDVSIHEYNWEIENYGLQFTNANPSFEIDYSEESIIVCLSIVDSRTCCASICETIEIEPLCADGPMCDYSICYPEWTLTECADGTIITSIQMMLPDGTPFIIGAQTPGFNFPYCYGYTQNYDCLISGFPFSFISDFPNDLNQFLSNNGYAGYAEFVETGNDPNCRFGKLVIENTCIVFKSIIAEGTGIASYCDPGQSPVIYDPNCQDPATVIPFEMDCN